MDTSQIVHLSLNLVAVAAFMAVGALMVKRRVPPAQMGGPFISIGILFTFAGILHGLLGFDTGDIEGSVPTLLDGIKTAFLTSVVGMGLAILARVYAIATAREDGPSGPSGEQFIAVMREQQTTLARIEKSMGGDGDHSILTQLRLANSTMTSLKAETTGMRTDLNAFARKLSEQSTDAIITALENVIRDFNTQLNEQFGDNFKQLNQGVERLVGWMEQHERLITASHQALRVATQSLNTTSTTLTHSAKSMKTAASSMSQVEQASKAVFQVARDTAVVVSELSRRLSGLSGDSQALAQSAASLHNAITQLNEANKGLTKALDAWHGLANESAGATAQVQAMVRSVAEHSQAVRAEHEGLIKQLRVRTQRMAKELMNAQQQFFRVQEAQLDAAAKRHGEALAAAHRSVMEQAQQDLRRSGELNHESIQNQLRTLDRGLEEELTKALQAMAGKLASLSEKFAADYRPLTEQLARVVRLAEDVERQRGGRRG